MLPWLRRKRNTLTTDFKIRYKNKKGICVTFDTGAFCILYQTKKEVTLDRIFTHTIKGHFCSLLISNIFWLSSLSLIALFLRLNPVYTVFYLTSLVRTPFARIFFLTAGLSDLVDLMKRLIKRSGVLSFSFVCISLYLSNTLHRRVFVIQA